MTDQDSVKPASLNIQPEDYFSLLSNPNSSVWELIFDSMPDMVALIDLNNIVVKANKAMRQKANIGDQSLVGQSCNSLMHDHGCMLSNCPHLSMINDKKPHSIDLFEPKFGLYLTISTTPIFDSENNLLGSLHIARDITLQKESEAKLIKFNNELNELNLSKDRFFGIVAHDLRSPFQGMLGFTDLILDELYSLTKEEIKAYLLKVRDSSYSTFTLLENLLDWSKLQTGRMQYNPSAFSLLEDVLAVISLMNSNVQSKNIRIINNLNNDYMVFADRRMVHSILLNLTSNAIKFSYVDGLVTFDAKISNMCEDTLGGEISSCHHKCLQISITDTGMGISAEGIKKIFDANEHYTLLGTSNEQGAGLGLLLVKEMTEKHGSKLTISSQPGEGSVFTFTLPLAEI